METIGPPLDLAEPQHVVRPTSFSDRRFSEASTIPVLVLSAWAALSALFSALYAQVYSLPFQMPDLEIQATTLEHSFGVLVVALGAVAGLVVVAGHPAASAALTRGWDRLWVRPNQTQRIALSAAVVGSAAYAYLRVTGNGLAPGAELDALTAGEGMLPFQYRALVPWLAGALASLGVFDPSSAAHLLWAYGTIEAVATVGTLFAFAALLREVGVGRAQSSVLALALFYPLYFSLAASYRYASIFFPWEMVSVGMFTWGLVLLLQRRWWVYYLVFAVATINRETTCFLTMAYVLLAFREERLGTIAQHVLAQFVLWMVIKAGLAWWFADNPAIPQKSNAFFWSTYLTNLHALSMLPGWAYLAQGMGGLWIVVLALWRWIGDRRLQRLLLVLVPFAVGMFFVGILLEVRVFSELIPVFLVAFLLIVRNGIRDTRARTLHLEMA